MAEVNVEQTDSQGNLFLPVSDVMLAEVIDWRANVYLPNADVRTDSARLAGVADGALIRNAMCGCELACPRV